MLLLEVLKWQDNLGPSQKDDYTRPQKYEVQCIDDVFCDSDKNKKNVVSDGNYKSINPLPKML